MPLNQIVDTRKDKNDIDDFMAEVRDNFDWAATFDEDNRIQGEDDLQALNGNQWDGQTLEQRKIDGRPALTINKLPSFVDQVKGDARLNQISIKVRANFSASKDQKNNRPERLAEIYNGLIRQIEQVSNAESARTTALDGGLQNGFGYYEIIADFVDDDTFEQELRTQRIKNQFSCYVDPMHVEADARDAGYWFKTDIIGRKAFKAKYPDIEPANFKLAKAGSNFEYWVKEDTVRVADYWIKRPFKKRLVSVAVRNDDDTFGPAQTYDGVKWDKVKDELQEKEQLIHFVPSQNPELAQTPQVGPAPEGSGFQEQIINRAPEVVRERDIDSHVVIKYIVDGTQIIDGPKDDNGKIILDFKGQEDIKDAEGRFRKFVWPGKYIPIIPVWGKELQIGNRTVRRSLIRWAKDAQKMYNYERTAETERVALAKIPPAVLTAKQLGAFKDMWASTANLKYLLYEPDGSEGAVPPFFPPPPQASSGNNLLSQTATQDMKDTMSIQNAALGIQGNEKSGRAILARQRENDVANFEFTDNLKNAVQLEGDIYVDLIPKTYDTDQEVLILNQDGTDEFVHINETIRDEDTGEEVILNDLTMGKYLVTVTTGPNFTTQRIETAEALTSLAAGVKDPLAGLILLIKIVKNQDWPEADATAEALEQLLPPQFRDLSDEEKAALAAQAQQQAGPDMDTIMDALKMQGQTLTNRKAELDINEKEAEQGKGMQQLQATLDTIQQVMGGQP